MPPEMLPIIRTALSILSFLIMIIFGCAGIYAWRKITTNHLHHMDMDIKDIKEDVKSNAKCITAMDKNLAIIATKMETKQ